MDKKKYIRVSDSFTIRNDSNGSFLVGIDSPIFSRGIGREITAIPNFAGLIFEKIGKLPYNESLNALGIETGIKPDDILHGSHRESIHPHTNYINQLYHEAFFITDCPVSLLHKRLWH